MPLARRRSLAGLVAIAATALIAGCGGGSDSLSAEDFRTQADAICADANRELDALTEPTSAEQFLPYIQAALPIQRAQLDRLKALDPPDDLQSDFDTGVTAIQEQIDAIDGAATRIEGGEDATAVVTDVTPTIESLNEKSDAAARSLGLTVCGSDSDTTATTPTTPTAPATTASTTPTAPTGSGDAAAYVADVQEAATALQTFGTLLQSTTGLDDLRAKVPEAQASLDSFDAAIAKLDGYTLSSSELEQQRAGLARTGPAVSDVLRRFLDAANEGDLAAVQALVPEVTRTIGEFQSAATGG